MGLELISQSFENKQFLDKKFSCKGENKSLSLHWINAPADTKSFALIVEDPDAPRKEPWVHWLVFNIPANIVSLSEDASKKLISKGINQGTNDFGNIGYGGPCPPAGKAHRYFFKLYALDTKLSLRDGASKNDILNAMEGHVLASTELIGLYQVND